MKSWISSAFESTCASAATQSLSSSRQSAFKKTTSSTDKSLLNMLGKENLTVQRASAKLFDGLSLCEKYEPKNLNDLVVNKSKVDQLSNVLDELIRRQKGSILLIEGPSGSGKYTTLKLLCKEKKVELVDWNNTSVKLDSLDIDINTGESNADYEMLHSNINESQLKLFKQFLFKSSRYLSDQIFDTDSDRKTKFLFVKEMPNFAFRELNAFQGLLRDFKTYSKFSIIFTLQTSSGSSNGDSNPHRIFTQDVRRELGIVELNFNAFANTYLTKQIERICKAEGIDTIDKKVIERMSANCNGDLRHAINMLELVKVGKSSSSKNTNKMTSSVKTTKPATTAAKKRATSGAITILDVEMTAVKDSSKQDFFDNNLKDPNYNIFRGIGKILHRKNLEVNEANKARHETEKQLPIHLKQFEREPMNINPEDIYNKINLSPDLILMYLYQNYIEMFKAKSQAAGQTDEEKLKALCAISENFLASDLINQKSNLVELRSAQDQRIKEISSLISMRSVLFNFNFVVESVSSSSHKGKGRGGCASAGGGGGGFWMPLYKPFNSKMNELRLKRKKLAKELILNNQYDDPCLINYLTDTHKEFFINYLPYFLLKCQFTNRRLYDSQSLLFAKYKQTNLKYTVGETKENDFCDENELNGEEMVLVDRYLPRVPEATIKGNYAYESADTFKVDENF